MTARRLSLLIVAIVLRPEGCARSNIAVRYQGPLRPFGTQWAHTLRWNYFENVLALT